MHRLATRFLSFLLLLLPRTHRERFRAEMTSVFDQQCAEAEERGGAAVVWLCIRVASDIARTGVALRLRRNTTAPVSHPVPASGGPDPGSWLQDARYAIRLLVAQPAFTLAAVLTLAFGMGANAAVFSLLNALLFRSPPAVAEPEDLVALYTREGGSAGVSSYLDIRDLEERVNAFSAVAAYKPLSMDIGVGGDTVRAAGLLVTGAYFDALGVEPARGRMLGDADDREPGAHPVVVLSWGGWERHFGADPEVVGRPVRLNGREFTVVGVAPRGFVGTALDSTAPDLFAPMMMQAHFMPSAGYLLDRRGWGGVFALARLAPDVTTERARAEVEAVGEWIAATYPRFAEGREYELVPLSEAALSPSMREPISRVGALLIGVTAVVLLIACVNVANLLLARSAVRRREIAVRQALGAGRGRVARQLLVETLALALLGGASGLALANFALETFNLLPLALPRGVGLDARVLLFTLGMSCLAGLGFGVVPALHATRSDLAGRLRDSGDLRRGGERRPAAKALVVTQVAFSVMLAVAAGLFARTLVELRAVDLGFEPEGVAVLGVDPGLQGYDRPDTAALYRDLLERVRGIPGVTDASLVSLLPGPDAGDVMTLYVEGTADDERMRFGFTIVDTDYLRTLRIPVARGRDFTPGDADSPRLVAIVNEPARQALRAAYGFEILGRQLGPNGPNGPLAEVVGVTPATKTGSLRAEPEPMIYLLFSQLVESGFGTRMSLVARTEGDAVELASALRAELRALAPSVPAFAVGTLADHVSGGIAQERSVAAAIAAAAGLSLLLSVIGLYGVLSYTVARRTREMGVRMALGASTGNVRLLVIRQGVGLAAAGVMLGLVGAAAASRLLESFLFGISRTDPWVYATMASLMLVVSAVSAWLPARRATRVDPVASLRRG